MRLVPLHPDFGVRIDGVSIADGVDAPTFDAVREAFERHSVVLMRDQTLDDEALVAFSQRFGALEPVHTTLANEKRVDYIARIGNVDRDGVQLRSDHPRVRYLRGNEMWHSDSSFRETPALASLLLAHEVPAEEGATEFVSTRAAYARLPESMRAELDPLVVIHDFVYSRSKVGPGVVTDDHAAMLPPVRHRLVRENPVTGERAYYVGSHARDIEGYDEARGRALIADLMARATRPEHVYRHRWRPGDLVIWDNRAVLHRGQGFDPDRYRRKLHRTTVAGLGPTLTVG
ncbi:MAG: TauD/TfdA family dioxygenase [Ectothiorhodospiraceae bacterium]|nr:TauD/TfdA family dioxygenase [Ectothiorhodospiraceae bacterium]